MKKYLFSLVMAVNFGASAQKNYETRISECTNDVYAMDYPASLEAVLQFMQTPGVKIMNQSEYDKTLTVSLKLTPDAYLRYDSLVATLGYSASKHVNVQERETRMQELELELVFLHEKRDSYAALAETLTPSSPNYISVWGEIQATKEKIFDKEREKLSLQNGADVYNATLTLHDEVTSPQNTGVSFVNMPGAEYSSLFIETPQKGISADYYQGYFLKYLFTKGKSYASIGIYKSKEAGESDTAAVSEMFVLGFGQDFYSRHFGRGSRKYLNLYSGYMLGCILATSDTSTDYLPYISPSVGIELYKNKYFLVDTKVSYLVPLINSRNLRGISYGASFNFVF